MPAADVLQMESYPARRRCPAPRRSSPGSSRCAGASCRCSISARASLPAVESTIDRRIVVGRHAGRPVGLLVDSAREVLDIPEEHFKPPPRMVADEAAGLVKAVAQIGPRLLMLLDFAKVIGQETLDGSHE